MSLPRLIRLLIGIAALAPAASSAQGQPALPVLGPGVLPEVPVEIPIAIPSPTGMPAPDFHFVDEDSLPFPALDGDETTRLWGVLLGAGYRIEVPAQWNGELVVWAWGFTGFCLEPDDTACQLLARTPWIRGHLLARGFAWANTSTSASGWSVSQGVLDNLQLVGEFTRLVGAPSRTYMIGVSMGAKIAAISNERGLRYDGTLSLCGDLGRNELGGVWADWNLLAATLAGEEARVAVPPDADYLTDVVPDVRAALGDPFPLVLREPGLRLRAASARLTGGARPRHDEAFTLADVLVFGSPETMFSAFGGAGELGILLHGDAEGRVAPWPLDGNEGVVYQLDDDPQLSDSEADLNTRVPRYPARASADAWSFPGVDGAPLVPHLVVHGLGDLLAPLSLAQRYAERVQANGAAEQLVTRATRGVTHCAFTTYEITRSFDDLVAWVETGARPEGDDLLDPEAVAAADFGCAFSGEAEGVPSAAGAGICGAE